MTLRTGVVGAGVVASNNHFPALSRNPRTELAAVCDLDRERAREAVDEHGGRAYDDPRAMFDAESLDWVHVATPVRTHFELAKTAIDAGAHVLLQKPATTTSEELTRLTERADERGVALSVVHNWLYYPSVRELRGRVASGEIGPVRAVQTTLAGEGRPDETYRGDWVFDLPGGAFEEGLPHPLYLTLALGGYPRDESAIDARTRLNGEYARDVAYDGVQLQYESESGALCSVTALADSSRGTSIRVLGADGSLTLDLPSMTVHADDDESGPYHFWEERFRRNLDRSRDAVAGALRNVRKYAKEHVEDEFDRHLDRSPDGHYYLIDEAARALEVGALPPREPAEAYWTLSLVEEIREAAADEPEARPTVS